MSLTYWILSGLLLLAAGMCLWAWLADGPGLVHEQHTPEHSKELRGETTRRLRAPAPDWKPHDERPGGGAPWPPPP